MSCSRIARKIIERDQKALTSPRQYYEDPVHSLLEDIARKEGFAGLVKAIEDVVECYRLLADKALEKGNIAQSIAFRSRGKVWARVLRQIIRYSREIHPPIKLILDKIRSVLEISNAIHEEGK